MSHFSTMVIGNDVEAQLAPFHEFECTGVDDQYIQNVDILATAREEYAKHADGGESFAAFAQGWYGAEPIVDGEPDLAGPHKYGWLRATADGDVVELIDRTNPNKRWDWWQIGGRFTGMLKLKPGAKGIVGRPGLMTQPADSLAGYTDSARKGDIDFAAMRDEAEAEAAETYDAVHLVIAGRPVDSWPTVRERYPENIDAAREAYHAQPVVRDLAKHDEHRWIEVERFLVSREAFLQSARDGAGVPFAAVKDSQWYERGKMGWFACVSNEKDIDQWRREFAELIDGLPDDTLLTIVDCHI
jgi:hypothetical protein